MTIEFYEPELSQKMSDQEKVEYAAGYILNIEKIKTIKETGQILNYDNGVYAPIDELEIHHKTEKLLINCTNHIRSEVLNKIKALTVCSIKDFDNEPTKLVLKNGILDIETWILTEHNDHFLSTVKFPVEYIQPKNDNIEENLKDTLFWKALKASFTVNGVFKKEDFETVLEILASPIIKKYIDEKNFLNLGFGENGKSAFLVFLESMLGQENVSHITLQDIENDKFMRANLAGKSANIFTDLAFNELKHTGIIKAITSNEGIESQRKHQQGFTLYPFCKLMFSCNRFPKVYDQTQGFFRRWIIVKWERNFENDPERIENLKEKLISNQEEKNLVFSNLVSIANKLNKAGKFTHSKDWQTIQKEWNENADPLDYFDSNFILYSENNRTIRGTYEFYKEVMIAKGEVPLRIYQFSRAFAEYHDQERVYNPTLGRNERMWLNIDFKRPKQTTLEEIDTS